MGTSNSKIIGDTIRDTSGGVLLSDEVGPTADNVVAHNWVLDDTEDCEITLAGHNPGVAPKGEPKPTVAGVYGNLIEDNLDEGNGVKGQGAGILMALASKVETARCTTTPSAATSCRGTALPV